MYIPTPIVYKKTRAKSITAKIVEKVPLRSGEFYCSKEEKD